MAKSVLNGLTIKNVTANQVMAGPTSGGAGDGTFRTQVVADLPLLNGFTNAAPALDDVMPFYDTSASGNRDATVSEMMGIGVEGFIQGCKLEYLTTTSVRVTPGLAMIQSSGKVLKLSANSDISPTLKTTLNGGINNSQTTAITVVDASIYPSTGRIKIDSEEIDYVGKNATQLGTTSVSRAANGTSAASHSSGADVTISQWYHLYLWDNAGTATVEVSTTDPASAWIGTAKSKTGDTSRRYLGSFRTNNSSNVLNFMFTGSGSEFLVLWRTVVSNTMRAVAAGTATTNAGGTFSVANMCPPGVRNVYARFFSNANQGLRTDSDDMTGTDPAANIGYVAISTAGGDIYCPHSINSSQQMRYAFAATVTNGGGFYCDIYGYFLER